MSIFQRTPVLRWVLPAAVAVLIIGGGAVLGSVVASSGSQALPARSAEQLLADVEQAQLQGLSGTVVQTSDLGIPSIPGIGGTSSSSLTSLVSGTHTLRVWYAGTTQFRLALMGSLGESDVIRNGPDLWTWSSQDNAATHRTLRVGKEPDVPTSLAAALPTTPQQAAAEALKAVGATTDVTTSTGDTVAGRAVYELQLKPKGTGSLIASVRIAVDGVEHLPLRVEVFAVGQADPAFQVAFSSVDFSKPDASEFAFNPPPGATVTQEDSQATPKPAARPAPTDPAKHADLQSTRTVGSGWTTVLVTDNTSSLAGFTGLGRQAGQGPSTSKLPAKPNATSDLGSLGRVLGALPTVSGTWGSGHLLSGKLFSVLITDKGVIAVGAVRPDLLYAALASK